MHTFVEKNLKSFKSKSNPWDQSFKGSFSHHRPRSSSTRLSITVDLAVWTGSGENRFTYLRSRCERTSGSSLQGGESQRRRKQRRRKAEREWESDRERASFAKKKKEEEEEVENFHIRHSFNCVRLQGKSRCGSDSETVCCGFSRSPGRIHFALGLLSSPCLRPPCRRTPGAQSRSRLARSRVPEHQIGLSLPWWCVRSIEVCSVDSVALFGSYWGFRSLLSGEQEASRECDLLCRSFLFRLGCDRC